MKKIVIGIIIGAALMFSGHALADKSSNIGKKVSSEHPLLFEGKKISEEAIVVGENIYIPSTVIDAYTGYAVRAKEGTIVIRKKVAKTGEPPLKEHSITK